MTGYTNNNDGTDWSRKDAVALALVIGAHALGLWQFVRTKPAPPPPEPVPLLVSLVIPPDEPPPPEPPKPPPPREQPKPPKEIPKPTLEPPPPVITEAPVAKPIEPPPPAPPTPPAPPQPQTSNTGSYLQIRVDCKPVYPRKALQNGIEGKVTLVISVDERGIPEKVEVSKSSGNFELDNAARAAAGRCVFVPQTVNGAPVKSKGLREIVFKLSEQ